MKWSPNAQERYKPGHGGASLKKVAGIRFCVYSVFTKGILATALCRPLVRFSSPPGYADHFQGRFDPATLRRPRWCTNQLSYGEPDAHTLHQTPSPLRSLRTNRRPPTPKTSPYHSLRSSTPQVPSQQSLLLKRPTSHTPAALPVVSRMFMENRDSVLYT